MGPPSSNFIAIVTGNNRSKKNGNAIKDKSKSIILLKKHLYIIKSFLLNYQLYTSRLRPLPSTLPRHYMLQQHIHNHQDWYDTPDTLILRNGIERIEVECNYNSCYIVKNGLSKDDVLVIDVYEGENDYSPSACTSITLEQMIELRDYLNHKIEYLQS